MSGELVQFLGSLIAILALAGIAWWLKLGGKPAISDEAHARRLAAEAVHGFAVTGCAISKNGSAALLCDAAGRVLLIRVHGAHFAARILGAKARAQVTSDGLLVHSGETSFGSVLLDVPEPQTWANRIDALNGQQDA